MSPALRFSTRSARLLLGLLSVAAAGCYTVGFHPLEVPGDLDPPVPARAGLYIDPELRDATYSFRSFGSGIGNRWTVPYGARLAEFGRVYLGTAFRDFREVDAPGPDPDRDVVVQIDGASYQVANQAAHVTLDVKAVDASGKELVDKSYSSRGWSGQGAVFGGGVFAQKGVTRSSTDQALREVFTELVGDLRGALSSQPPAP